MLMARWGSIFTAPALEWRIVAQHWPARGDRRDGQPLGALVLVIGVVWLAVALRDVTAGGSTIAGFGVAAAWVSLAIGAALALWGCRILVRRQSIWIGDHDIQVRVRHLLGETSWHESLRHYGGVVWRSEPIRGPTPSTCRRQSERQRWRRSSPPSPHRCGRPPRHSPRCVPHGLARST
jgi:hypothetical protein